MVTTTHHAPLFLLLRHPSNKTRYFGRGGDAAPALATYALRRWRSWEERIVAWQRPVLEDPALPSFYKSLLFNELYFLADGGTVWTDSIEGRPNNNNNGHDHDDHAQQQSQQSRQLQQLSGGDSSDGSSSSSTTTTTTTTSTTTSQNSESKQMMANGEQEIYGQFLYLEGHEYLMYNTYDVHFYASFALASLWPQLQLSLQRDFARAVLQDDSGTVRKLLGSGELAPRKVKGAVPHDLGSPCEEPWTKVPCR